MFSREEGGVDKVVWKTRVRGMFFAHRSVRYEKKCGLNGNSALFYGLWSSGKVWLKLIDRKCSYGVIFQTRLDMYMWNHATHILSKVGMLAAIGCKL